ncbi:hypothetical protein D9757_011095 [Collybiopsis confluens]|uniref:Uncharacterized protein n=1 Tax=Collybiopsis confluens TaxID=2823264 RepID=A0A8H5GWY6_9AGAR|nr:hypothetical protein D9757_011095 [Collybiopsis confluens]
MSPAGRTARVGRAGKATLFTTQYDVDFVQRLETALGKKLVEWETSKEDVLAMLGTVDEAGRVAAREVRAEESKGKKGRDKRKRGDGGGGAGTGEVSYEGIEEVAMLRVGMM